MAGSCQVSVLVENSARRTGAALSVGERPVPRLADLRLGAPAASHHRRRPGRLIASPRSSIFMPGEHVYRFYEQAGNRHHRSIDLCSLQAAARPAHSQSERALNLVMTHRLRPVGTAFSSCFVLTATGRTLEWWADVLEMDVQGP